VAADRSLSVTEREEIATIVKDKPENRSRNQLRLQFGRYQRRSHCVVQALGRALSMPI